MNEARIKYGALGVAETIVDHARETKSVVVKSQGVIEISDGYHTMDELYTHRIELFITLARVLRRQELTDGADKKKPFVWRSKKHSDGELPFGTETQFLLGIGYFTGHQITYHLPVERWEQCDFAETLEKAPEFDGHTSTDVLGRLKMI